MSQKTNPITLRLGIKKTWFLKHLEKKTYDFKNFLFYQLEIKKFIKLFFKKYKLELKTYKTYFKRNSLHFFIMYDTKKLNLKNSKKIKTKLSSELFLLKKFYKKFNLKKTKTNFKPTKKTVKYIRFLHFFFKKNVKYKSYFNNYSKFTKWTEKSLKHSYNYLLNKNSNILYLKRFFAFKYFFLLKTSNLNLNLNLFLKKLKNIIKLFLKNKTNIILTVKQFNRSNFKTITNNEKFKLLINLVNLKKFQYYNFFESGINLFFEALNNKKKLNLAHLISNYISSELSKMKDLKFLNVFFKFLLNKIKYFLIVSKKIKSIEIKIKGNLNKSQRSVSKTLILGKKVPKLLINNNLYYNESTVYSKKGTFGVKTWLH